MFSHRGSVKCGRQYCYTNTASISCCTEQRSCVCVGDRYDGEFKNGQEDGMGIFTWADGSTYNGFWREGCKEGVGVYRPASTENKRATTPLERHTTQPAGERMHLHHACHLLQQLEILQQLPSMVKPGRCIVGCNGWMGAWSE